MTLDENSFANLLIDICQKSQDQAIVLIPDGNRFIVQKYPARFFKPFEHEFKRDIPNIEGENPC